MNADNPAAIWTVGGLKYTYASIERFSLRVAHHGVIRRPATRGVTISLA
jgi:hypothetical protein